MCLSGEQYVEEVLAGSFLDELPARQAPLTETQQSANSAAMAASLANTFSDKAVTASLTSLTLAEGARAEADSFEADISRCHSCGAEARSVRWREARARHNQRDVGRDPLGRRNHVGD
jgi:hypothetical protein